MIVHNSCLFKTGYFSFIDSNHTMMQIFQCAKVNRREIFNR